GRRALFALALLGGALAPFAGSPFRAQRGRVDVERLAAMAAREEDHLTAAVLDGWIKDRHPRLRGAGPRAPAESAAYRRPGSDNVALTARAATAIAPAETVVLVSDAGGHAGQAWVFLQALGQRQTYFLRGGIGEWMEDVMNPVAGRQPAAALT